MKSGTRLTYTSDKAFFRSLQMSRTNLFIFIEGKTDRYLYSKICESHFLNSKETYEIRLAAELPGNQGGKKRLIKYFKYLNRSKDLVNNSFSKKTICLFLVDKDVDDILNKIIVSDHLHYTKYYSIENYFFLYGNIIESIAAATSLEHKKLMKHFNIDNSMWCKNAAVNWKEWVKFCVFSRYRNVNCICNYSVPSKLQNPYEEVENTKYNDHLNEIRKKSKLTNIGFKRVFNKISNLVDELYDTDQHNKIFNGKWFVDFLIADVKSLAGNKPYITSSLNDRILVSLQVSLNVNQSWVSSYYKIFDKLVSKI